MSQVNIVPNYSWFPDKAVLKKYGFPVSFSLLAIAIILYRFIPVVNFDVSWAFIVARKLLGGAELYKDIIDVNPPLIFYMKIPVVLMADGLGITATHSFYIFSFILIALSLTTGYRLLRDIQSLTPLQKSVFMLVFLFAVGIMPASFYGEREHLLAIFMMPYMLLMVQRYEGHPVSLPMAVWVGFFAFWGFALKPFFLLVPVGLELWYLAKHKNLKEVFRPENWVLGVMMLAFLAFILVYLPDYLGHVVPMGVLIYGTGYNGGLGAVLSVSAHYIWVFSASLIVLSAIHKIRNPFFMVFSITIFALLFVFAIQMKGWFYQVIPAVIMVAVFSALIFADIIQKYGADLIEKKVKSQHFIVFIISLISVFMMGRIGILCIQYGHFNAKGHYQVKEFLERSGPVQKIFVLGAEMPDNFPLTNLLKAEWASRFPSLWLMPGLVKQLQGKEHILTPARRKALENLEHYNRQAVLEDMQKFKPDTVLVDVQEKKKHFRTSDFDFLSYFLRSDDFEGLWKHYHKIGHVRGFDVYRRK